MSAFSRSWKGVRNEARIFNDFHELVNSGRFVVQSTLEELPFLGVDSVSESGPRVLMTAMRHPMMTVACQSLTGVLSNG